MWQSHRAGRYQRSELRHGQRSELRHGQRAKLGNLRSPRERHDALDRALKFWSWIDGFREFRSNEAQLLQLA